MWPRFWGASTKRWKDAGRVDSGSIGAAEDAPARSVIAFQKHGGHRREGRSGGRRTQLRAPGADRPHALLQACPRPRLDLLVAHGRLRACRLEVLEPGVGLLDEKQLFRLALTRHVHSGWWIGRIVGPRSDGAFEVLLYARRRSDDVETRCYPCSREAHAHLFH